MYLLAGFRPLFLLFLSPSSFNFEAGYWGAFRDTAEVSQDACQTIHFQPVWSGHRMVLGACYFRWRYPPHFLRREIVDTVLRTNQTLLKTRKHAFFFKVGWLDPDFFAFDSCLEDLSADRDVRPPDCIMVSVLWETIAIKNDADHKMRKSIMLRDHDRAILVVYLAVV